MVAQRYGIDSMMYTARSPWDGIGTRLDGAATSTEAMEAAGLNWEVDMREVFIQSPEVGISLGFKKIPGKFSCTRRDTGTSFGVFSSQYVPVQNLDKFKFIDRLVADGQAVFHSAGSLNGGAKTWLYLQLPGDLEVTQTDVLERGILLTDSFDGGSALGLRFMTTRKLCSNTLPGLVSGRGNQFRGKHTISLMSRVVEARQIMGLEEAHSAMIMRGINQIAQEAMDKAQLEEFLVQLFGQEEEPDAISVRVQNQMNTVAHLFVSGLGNVGETKWDALNAVTEFVDYHRGGSSKPVLEARNQRLHASWFGAGSDLKQTAWELLVPAGATS